MFLISPEITAIFKQLSFLPNYQCLRGIVAGPFLSTPKDATFLNFILHSKSNLLNMIGSYLTFLLPPWPFGVLDICSHFTKCMIPSRTS